MPSIQSQTSLLNEIRQARRACINNDLAFDYATNPEYFNAIAERKWSNYQRAIERARACVNPTPVLVEEINIFTGQ